MQRDVSCRIEVDAPGVTDVVLSVAVAAPTTEETLSVTLDGEPVEVREVIDQHGTRLHLADGVAAGHLTIDYSASVAGRTDPLLVTELDRIRYLRPSRYCESDKLAPFANREFAGLRGQDLVDGVSSWVGSRLTYLAGSSRPIDGAVSTLLAHQGVCRDFAHLVVALLRACDLPARLVSVYAPGLQPMDFHAVAEVALGGEWVVIDATSLAPRSTLLRIATGRDAADTAFLTTSGDLVTLTNLEVVAVASSGLPADDLTLPAHLG